MKRENALSIICSSAVVVLVIIQTYAFIERGEDYTVVGNESMEIVVGLFAHLGFPLFLLLMSYQFIYPISFGKENKSGFWLFEWMKKAFDLYTIFVIATMGFMVVFFTIAALAIAYTMLVTGIVAISPLADYVDQILLFEWVVFFVTGKMEEIGASKY